MYPAQGLLRANRCDLPPYWGLRDYGTAKWEGGDDDCEHNARIGDLRFTHPISDKQRSNAGSAGSACVKCGAIRIDKQLGLERKPEEYVNNMVAVFREVRRVLKDDGTVWLNLGDSYQSGCRGSYDRNRNGVNKNLGCGENHNDFLHAPNRYPQVGLKNKDLVGIPWRVAFALQADAWWLRSDIIWSKPNPMPESVTDRPTKAHEYIFLLAKSGRYYYDAEAIKDPATCGDPRKPYAPGQVDARGNGHDRNGGKIRPSIVRGQFNGKTEAMADEGRNAFRAVEDYRNKRSVWTIATQPFPDAHFATFPEDLIKPCILAGAPVGGVVLDPFVGSGTTVKVAQDLGRIGIGLDLKAEYLHMARYRTAQQGLKIG